MLKSFLINVFFILSLASGSLGQDIVLTQDGESLKIAPRRGLYLLEKSTNLEQWKIVNLVYLAKGTSLSEKTESEASGSSLFYRLHGPINESDEFEIEFNGLSKSSHLASLTYADRVKVEFFGSRYSSGLPAKIDSVTFMVDGEIISVKALEEPDESSLQLVDEIATFENLEAGVGAKSSGAVDFDFGFKFDDLSEDLEVPDLSNINTIVGSGFLVVSRESEFVERPQSLPEVQVVAQDLIQGHRTFDVKASFIESKGLDDIYSYEIVMGQTLVTHQIDVWKRFIDSLECVIPGKISKTPTLSDFAFVLCALDLELYPPRTFPPEFVSVSVTDIFEAQFRGVIPGQNAEVLFASPWSRFGGMYTSDSWFGYFDVNELPTLIIPISEQGGSTVVQSRSFNFPVNHDVGVQIPMEQFNFSNLLEGRPVNSIDRIEWLVSFNDSGTQSLLDVENKSPSLFLRNGWLYLYSVSQGGERSVEIPEDAAEGYGYFRANMFNWDGNLYTESNFGQTRQLVQISGKNNFRRLIDTDYRHFDRYYKPFAVGAAASFSHEVFRKYRQYNAVILENYGSTVSGSLTIVIYFKN